MNKFGLFLDFIGFCMLVYQSYVIVQRKVENGGGTGNTPVDEELQMERSLKWIKQDSTRKGLSRNWQLIAFGLIALGMLLQLFS